MGPVFVVLDPAGRGTLPVMADKGEPEDGPSLEMPSFFGYIIRYVVPFLVPVFVIVTWVFF